MKIFFYPVLIFLILTVSSYGQSSKLTVEVDERIELLTTVQLLSGYEWLTEASLDYKKEVEGTFNRHKNHGAVKFYKAVSNRFYGYDPLLLMCHYKLPDFKISAGFTPEDQSILYSSLPKDSLDIFIYLLQDFYTSTNFNRFFYEHKGYYELISANVKAEAREKDFTKIMEEHYGQSNYAYQVILSPLQMDAGFGPMVKTHEGDILYAIVGPSYNSESFPEFDKDALFRELVIHEFSHSFCNPAIDLFFNRLKNDSCLIYPILTEQKEQGYGEWRTCLYEHLTRANEIVLNEIIYGKDVADTLYITQTEEDKWIYLKCLVPLIRDEYTHNRKKYPTITAIMPKVVEYLEEEKKKCR